MGCYPALMIFDPALRLTPGCMVRPDAYPCISCETGQEPCHQTAALNEAIDFDMLVQRVIVGSAKSQTVQRRQSHRAREIAIGTAARTAVYQIETELLRDGARLLIQRNGSGI